MPALNRLRARTHAKARRLRPLKLLRLSNNKKSGPAGFPTGSRPAPNKSLRDFLEIWEREAAPAELTLILATILSRHAFGSEGVPLNESAAEAVG